MRQHSRDGRVRAWHDGAHASLCLLGRERRRIGSSGPLERGLTLHQKVLTYTPVQEVEMLFVALLAGAKAVAHTGPVLRADPALQRVPSGCFGLPGCAGRSAIAEAPTAATEGDVAALRAVLEAQVRRHGRVRVPEEGRGVAVLDLDLSPMPTSKRCEGAERGSMGRHRATTGRKLVRVREAAGQEILWQDAIQGNAAETLGVAQRAAAAVERLPGPEGDDEATRATRARVEFRPDSGRGTEAIINWLLARGYQVTGKFESTSRVKKLAGQVERWEPTASPGRDVAAIPSPVALAAATAQYAVRTPSKEHPSGYYHAALVTSRTALSMQEVVRHYDRRAGGEAELKADQRGLGLIALRRRKLAARKLVVLPPGLAHNLLIRPRRWLSPGAPRLAELGIVRLLREAWAVPGRVKPLAGQPACLAFHPQHPRAEEVADGFRHLLAGQTP